MYWRVEEGRKYNREMPNRESENQLRYKKVQKDFSIDTVVRLFSFFQMTQLSRKEKKNLRVHLSYEDKVPSKTNMC